MDTSPVPTEENSGQLRGSHRYRGALKSECRRFADGALEKFTQKLPLETQCPNLTEGSNEEKCLTTTDLVSLGMGSACGIGMYLTAGIIAGKMAGPGSVLSIVVGGIGSLMSGLHYAELAVLCPRTSGSSYFYTYVTIGELAAFLIGWGLMAEYIVCAAFAAVATSRAVNSASDDLLVTHVYEKLDRLGLPRIDIIAAFICIFLTWLLAIGVQMSAKVNNLLNVINMAVLAVFTAVSAYLGSFSNWKKTGFAPYGYEGILSATPIAYSAFIGFDAVSTTGRECKDPIKSIPRSIILANILNAIIFVIVVAGLTWDVPYKQIQEHTAMLDVFEKLGVVWVKYVIALGAVAGLLAAAFGSMFPLPRILQSMARDDLLFRYFGHICPKRQTPFRATLFTGAIATILASIADVSLILELTLICTLFTYIIVVMATLVARFVNLRLEPDAEDSVFGEQETGTGTEAKPRSISIEEDAASCHERHPNSNTRLQGAIASYLENTTPDHRQTPGSNTKENVKYFDKNAWLYKEKKEDKKRDYPSTSSYKAITNSGEVNMVARSLSASSSEKLNFGSFTSLEKQPILPKDNRRFGNCKLVSLYYKCLSLIQRHLMKWLLALYIALFGLSFIVSRNYQNLKDQEGVGVVAAAILIFLVISTTILTMLLPQVENASNLGFRTRLIPLISVFTAAFNIYLMVILNTLTWLLFCLWMGFGLCVYVLYGTFQRGLCRRTQYERMEEED